MGYSNKPFGWWQSAEDLFPIFFVSPGPLRCFNCAYSGVGLCYYSNSVAMEIVVTKYSYEAKCNRENYQKRLIHR